MTPEDRDRLRELAEIATPGPWDTKYVYEAVRHIARNCDFVEGDDPEFGWDRYNDSPFIAAAHPQAVLALLDDLQDARELLNTFTDDEPCSLDHHGYCQAHGWFGEEECNVARARRLLAPDEKGEADG